MASGILRAPYRAAVKVGGSLVAPYRAARWASGILSAPYAAGVQVWGILSAPYRGDDPAMGILFALYRGTAQALGILTAPYRGEDPQPPDPPAPVEQPDGVRLEIGGVELDPVRISLTWSREQSAIEAEVELPDETPLPALPPQAGGGLGWGAARHTPATLELWGYTFEMLIDGRSRSESFGQHTWTLRLASPAAGLDLPWADGVEGELTGQASAIARRLAGNIPLTWSAVDWRIGPGRWIANGESPLALLQTLASAVGAAVNSAPDGGLVVAPLYPVSPQDWPAAPPAAIITTTGEVITLATGEERKDGINAITVSDAGEISRGVLRLDEDDEKRRGGTTEVLVYQAPWMDNFTVTHRGNPEVASVQFMALEEPIIADEEIIIQDGKGQAQYPVYAIIGARWNWRNLGTPTFAESGEITVEPQDESILLLTYRTRRKRYRASEVNKTELLVVAEDEA